ncbi:hypothetical protein Enr10x_36960 [Gimesia panareensis]|uniref:Uncharacterized protein n=1 Tax=Gimesia panareensis TaxID=2527978 RepID=A0A517Q9P7_9PLAN|nr:hypothetical protein [Gimesia panareensis]QDT28354.1 hypothetical protein Enr10x_36960 [Gimesia panareensis]
MPNGRPGDHPAVDILVHGISSGFPDDIFETVRDLAQHPKYPLISDRVDELLWKYWPSWRNANPDLDEVRRQLQALREELDQAE